MLRDRLVGLRGTLLAAFGTALVSSCGNADRDPVLGSGGSETGGTTGRGGAVGRGGIANGGSNARGGAPTFGGTKSEAGAGGSGAAVAGGAGGRGGAGKGGSATGGAGGAGGFEDTRCVPVRAWQSSVPAGTGYVECEGGWLHRPAVDGCPSRLPADGGNGGANSGGGGAGGDAGAEGSFAGGSNCHTNADCTDAEFGFCFTSGPGGPWLSHWCLYGCTDDAGCGAGEICVCGDPVGRCMRATCVSDADCARGSLCAGTPQYGICGEETTYAFACQTAADECMSPADCGAGEVGAYEQDCSVETSGRSCQAGSACGRPFLVRGLPRQAHSRYGAADWAAPCGAMQAELPARVREELADHWTQLGLMEHASVAAFARFALELLALGAPAELLEATQRALGDEITHARLCFGLASSYAGREIGPSGLPLSGALEARSPSVIVETAILEACLGETLAAAEAEAALEQASDPQVREALLRIAADEAQHAELGWRFLSWVLSRAEPALRTHALDALAVAIERATAEAAEDEMDTHTAPQLEPARTLRAHGLLSDARRLEARRLALSEVVIPCALALRDPGLARVA